MFHWKRKSKSKAEVTKSVESEDDGDSVQEDNANKKVTKNEAVEEGRVGMSTERQTDRKKRQENILEESNNDKREEHEYNENLTREPYTRKMKARKKDSDQSMNGGSDRSSQPSNDLSKEKISSKKANKEITQETNTDKKKGKKKDSDETMSDASEINTCSIISNEFTDEVFRKPKARKITSQKKFDEKIINEPKANKNRDTKKESETHTKMSSSEYKKTKKINFKETISEISATNSQKSNNVYDEIEEEENEEEEIEDEEQEDDLSETIKEPAKTNDQTELSKPSSEPIPL